jgi:4-hydroxy-tetrahydrodipicolinate synthase
MTFSGVIPILPTPFHDDETLDLQSWRRLLEFMVGLGVDGVTVLGVLGESNRLTDDERDHLIGTAVEVVARRVPLIVGTSHTGTRAATSLSQRAERLGADAVMVSPEKEPVTGEERIVDYYSRIANGISIPIVLQDHPASTEVHMPAELILRVVQEVPSIACVKEEAVPTANKVRQLRRGLTGRAVTILTGLGALYAPFDLEAGSDGFNTGFAFPEVLRDMLTSARGGDWERVHAIYSRVAALIVCEQQPGVAVRKELFRRRGLLESARVRHPGASVLPEQAAQLDGLLERTFGAVDLARPVVLDELIGR